MTSCFFFQIRQKYLYELIEKILTANQRTCCIKNKLLRYNKRQPLSDTLFGLVRLMSKNESLLDLMQLYHGHYAGCPYNDLYFSAGAFV